MPQSKTRISQWKRDWEKTKELSVFVQHLSYQRHFLLFDGLIWYKQGPTTRNLTLKRDDEAVANTEDTVQAQKGMGYIVCKAGHVALMPFK